MSAGMKRMTAQDAPNGQASTAEESVLQQGKARILGARRGKAATGGRAKNDVFDR
jgi:hypothetical protein